MSEAPMTGAERRLLLRLREENAGLRVILSIVSDSAAVLVASQRPELDQPGAPSQVPPTVQPTSPVTAAVESRPVVKPVMHDSEEGYGMDIPE